MWHPFLLCVYGFCGRSWLIMCMMAGWWWRVGDERLNATTVIAWTSPVSHVIGCHWRWQPHSGVAHWRVPPWQPHLSPKPLVHSLTDDGEPGQLWTSAPINVLSNANNAYQFHPTTSIKSGIDETDSEVIIQNFTYLPHWYEMLGSKLNYFILTNFYGLL